MDIDIDDLMKDVKVPSNLPISDSKSNSNIIIPGRNTGMSITERRKREEEEKKREKMEKEIEQAERDAFLLEQQTQALKKLQESGEINPLLSPLNLAFRRRSLDRKLQIIIENILIPENFKGEKMLEFPEYKGVLISREFASGRYQSGQHTKIRYAQQPLALKYYEYIPELNENDYDTSKEQKEIIREITTPEIITIGKEKNIFKYIPTSKAIEILSNLKAINGLIKNEKDLTSIPERYLPFKKVTTKNGSELKYITDDSLKLPLDSFIADQEITGLVPETNKVAFKNSYTETYLPIGKEETVLNLMLGENNWTIEVSEAHKIDVKNAKIPSEKKPMIIVRGYYLDALGNFKYGQMVSDSETTGTDVEKSAVLIGKLRRAILADMFAVFKGLGVADTEKIDMVKKRLENAANMKGIEKKNEFIAKQEKEKLKKQKLLLAEREHELRLQMFEWAKQHDMPKMLESYISNPMKHIKETMPEPVKRISNEDSEEEKKQFSKRNITITNIDEDFKDITVMKPKGSKEETPKEN